MSIKKFLCSVLLALGLAIPIVALPASASAVNVFGACSGTNNAGASDVCKSQNAGASNPFTNAIKIGLNILTFIVGVAAVVMLIFSGLKMMWAQGDAQAIKSARGGMIGAAVGIAIAALAQAIVVFVLTKVG